MKKCNKIFIFLILFLSFILEVYSYRVKESPTDRFKIENFKDEIIKTNFKFDEFGKVKDYGILGYYNFIPLKTNNKISAYACLTHLKVYDRHEPFIVIISLDGKIIDYSIPEVKKKHIPLNSESVKKMVIGQDKNNVKMDAVAGSTYHVPAINAELKNILNIFDYRGEIIRKDEVN
ncbi:hypothetical protein [Fusobacterium sp.]|uniref:hypothetical protein n=1 Tax=Fusobacterium sp. TaxID=68766 RepID=UPI0029010124|nr:hypothetical protein [Fusobacterium sp.]MDU1911445.1 hypothetical protein [Fusobacterium sp.]